MPFNAIGSVVGSLVGGLFQNKAIDKQNEFNAVENQKNRDFNAQQATIAYNRQRAIIDANNEYESAKAQRERLEAAGLNPYLMMFQQSAADRFGQISAEAFLLVEKLVVASCVGSQCNDRDVLTQSTRLRAQGMKALDSIHLRHEMIHQNGIVVLFPGQLQTFSAAQCHVHLDSGK